MDRSSGAGQLNPAAVAGSVRTVLNHHQTQLKAAEVSTSILPSAQPRLNYAVADLFGRCFLRVCYWVDIFASMTRRGEPLPYVPFTHQQVRSLASIKPAQELLTDSTETVIGTQPVANA
jgi:hypothetical protein